MLQTGIGSEEKKVFPYINNIESKTLIEKPINYNIVYIITYSTALLLSSASFTISIPSLLPRFFHFVLLFQSFNVKCKKTIIPTPVYLAPNFPLLIPHLFLFLFIASHTPNVRSFLSHLSI